MRDNSIVSQLEWHDICRGEQEEGRGEKAGVGGGGEAPVSKGWPRLGLLRKSRNSPASRHDITPAL